MRINVRVSLGSYDYAHPSTKECQVYVELEDVARASYLLPADRYNALRDAEWGDVLDAAHEYFEGSGWVSDSGSTGARAAVRAWLAVDENRDDLNVAWFQDRAQRDPVSRSLMADKTRLTTENQRLTALVAAMHAASVGETRPPLLGLVEDVAITRGSFLAQQHRAESLDRIARELQARVAALEAERASTNAAVAAGDVEREGLLKRIAELEADSARLDALDAAGVDNWEGYDDAVAGDRS